MKDTQLPDTKELLLAVIENVIYYGGQNNFAILPFGRDYYIQMAASKGDHDIYVEAVSNNYLFEEAMLSEKQIQHLKQLSWHPPSSKEGNFFLNHKVDSEASRLQLAELILQTAREIYGIDEIREEDVNLNLE